MNTVRSFWVGWGSLCIAGGGAYYFAKQSIDAERRQRREERLKRQQMQAHLEHAPLAIADPSSSFRLETKTTTPIYSRLKGRSRRPNEQVDMPNTLPDHGSASSGASIHIKKLGMEESK